VFKFFDTFGRKPEKHSKLTKLDCFHQFLCRWWQATTSPDFFHYCPKTSPNVASLGRDNWLSFPVHLVQHTSLEILK